MNADRCVECFDPCPNGWSFCRRCHSWSDLHVALQHVGTIGLDEHRLHGALHYLVPRPRRSPTMTMFEQLRRRVAELEQALS
jgi:hypothetical protein